MEKKGVGYRDSWKRRGKLRSVWTHAVAAQHEHSAQNCSERMITRCNVSDDPDQVHLALLALSSLLLGFCAVVL